jgi:hypothetical protein
MEVAMIRSLGIVVLCVVVMVAVAFPLAAFALGGTVVVTAVPERGENIVMSISPGTLERIR